MNLKPAPKNIKRNIAYRKAILARAAVDEEFQHTCWLRCKHDPIWYTDTFLWTFNPNLHPDNPYRPFILWPYQERALTDLCAAIGKYDVPIKKSRDAGASWLCLVAFEHRWHFVGGQTFLLVSRVASLVDEKNNPDALFWKIDALHERQPQWLMPRRERQLMKLFNLDNGSTINGCSTTADAGRGGRRTAILLDEFAAVEDGFGMLKATAPNSRCRIMNSTPQGTGDAYAERLEKTEKKYPERVITMHWSGHPIKRLGLYRVTKPDAGEITTDILDKEWHDKHPNYKFVTGGPFFWSGELRSPWYDEQCERAASPAEIAKELDMKMAESESQYFDAHVLTRLREKYSREPTCRGEIVWDDDNWEEARCDQTENGRLLLWVKPEELKQCFDLVIGNDVATGKGGDMSSNSVASIVRASTGEKIGEFTVNTLSPYEFCDYVIALAHWCNKAFVIYEDQGPGGEFTRRLLQQRRMYPNVYRRDKEEGTLSKKKSKKFGFAPMPQAKRALLADYRNALASEKFINHCDEALAECGEYIVLPTGDIEHSKARSAQDPQARKRNHGDRVIADSLAFRACQDRGYSPREPKVPESVPQNCALARRMSRQRAANQLSSW